MDKNYIIDRLKQTPYKYAAVAFLRARLNNLDEKRRNLLLADLKKEVYKESNYDIQNPLTELIYHMPIAS